MPELTPIRMLDQKEVAVRQEQGLMVPLHEGDGLQAIDCADDRHLTLASYNERAQRIGSEVTTPGRYYGAASGILIASLGTIVAVRDERFLQRFVGEFTPEVFVDLAADFSDRAHKLDSPIEIVQHSDDNKEQKASGLAAPHECPEPLGCAFATLAGKIVTMATTEGVYEESQRVASEAGEAMPLKVARESLTLLHDYIPEGFGVTRGALHHAYTKSRNYTPISVHEGAHAPSDSTAVVIDMAGWRSNAYRHNQQQMPRYHHTLDLPNEVMQQIMPELELDPTVLRAVSLLLGSATRFALSGDRPHALGLEIIPADIRVA